ncbi:NADPH-dependent F420 reductase [Paucibacter sp. XJ19-41]|uniref:NADPH-dependent F420 reductase n=1 Tax=Paucibacter sp. XJ19-41 TaxID=2927824 RepID=UPI00234A1367|nr:NAD(P)-binding domain-containing protein [Paucibacter sp. XJ19-41]MDC6169381.1 NAD(P)-binding domain-containing protein [Paucibacter sp. XJ19-41]
MTYSIIGSGNVGSALARQFARSGIAVGVANARGPDSIEALEKEFAGYVTAQSLQDAVRADVVILAIPFAAHEAVARAGAPWTGRIVVDAMNTYGVPPEALRGQPSSLVVASAFGGAHVVKSLNQLPAKLLASDPVEHGGRRVMFLAGDDGRAVGVVAKLVGDLGFAPIALGTLAGVGTLLDKGGALILQNLVKQG